MRQQDPGGKLARSFLVLDAVMTEASEDCEMIIGLHWPFQAHILHFSQDVSVVMRGRIARIDKDQVNAVV